MAFRPGAVREHRIAGVSGHKRGEGLVAVESDAAVNVAVRIESVHDGLLVTGGVDTTASGVCGRCLAEIEIPVEVEFHELFAYPSDYEVLDDYVNLEPLIRDAVVLALPFQPVCFAGCRGLDPETGERLADTPQGEPRERVDPRWSALTGFQSASYLGDHDNPASF